MARTAEEDGGLPTAGDSTLKTTRLSPSNGQQTIQSREFYNRSRDANRVASPGLTGAGRTTRDTSASSVSSMVSSSAPSTVSSSLSTAPGSPAGYSTNHYTNNSGYVLNGAANQESSSAPQPQFIVSSSIPRDSRDHRFTTYNNQTVAPHQTAPLSHHHHNRPPSNTSPHHSSSRINNNKTFSRSSGGGNKRRKSKRETSQSRGGGGNTR